MNPIRVVLVDDQSLVRAGITALLSGGDDGEPIEVVGEASGGTAGAALVRRLRPAVVLMDIRMPEGDGIAAVREIRSDPGSGDVAILMLTTFDTDDEVLGAMRAGADGYLLKDTAPEPLRAAVRAAARGEPALSPGVARQVMAHAATAPRPFTHDRLERLTAREREVLGALADGDDNAAVARMLSLSPETVRTYVHRILAKLEAGSRAQLVAIAHRSGLAAPHRRG
ncbi:DNA-binding response regulator [Actinoplanes italicus]|uniref:DNA-binding NarL/FixJ family response regulator n=1 Tax=Actinoplanes italicus TaxID=113567 RepID=A0A2T0KD85_9ACTN|nr:response regulator transcription factor [Actinoplanes italicus]PRX21256.1 DNA-binding NarL/FixJ family response regulator [Actinoplanes italicus]GIE36405.1 DNA-binding response regulator [Actinoplanes italicus]